jgi:PPOX class probable F420-dependent enzyme
MGADAGTPLDGETYINLETFKRDGTGVKTPVWVAPLDGRLVIFTAGSSYKVKRVRRNPSCRAAACDVRGNLKGPWYEGQCRVLDEEGGRRAHQALRNKYGWKMAATDFFARLAGRTAGRAYLEVTLQDRTKPT